MRVAEAGLREPPEWERVLVRLPNWVGDVVMATPALRALRRALPGARIAVALKDYVVPVISGATDVDLVIPIGSRGEKLPRGAWSLARRLRAERFDAAILLTNSLTSAIPVCLARIPYRVGYSGDWRRPLLSERIDPRRGPDGARLPIPMTRFYLELLEHVGIPAAGPEYELPVAAADRTAARRLLVGLGWDPKRPLAAINPGARFGSSKLWLPDRFAEVARRLVRDRDFQVVILCGPGEEEIAGQIARDAGEGVLDTSRSPAPLDVLRGLLDQVQLVVTTDTGPRHMATALGRPTVVIMGSTHPEWTAWNLERSRVLRHDVPCGPCHLRSCPTDHRCMTLVTVDEVLAAVDELL